MFRGIIVFCALGLLPNTSIGTNISEPRLPPEQEYLEVQPQHGQMYLDGHNLSEIDAPGKTRNNVGQSNAQAHYNPGIMHKKGQGLSRADRSAWHRRAADQSNERAQLTLVAGDASRDPNDVVAQILNYSSFGNDDGTELNFWYQDASDKCRYKLLSASWFLPMVIDLNALDPRNIRFEYRRDRAGTATVVRHDTDDVFFAPTQLDFERLKRGWSLIYSKYCKGKQKLF